MSDDLYDESVHAWDRAFDNFIRQRDWPDYAGQWGFPSSLLRSFWEEHGCVRCWFETHLAFNHHLPTHGHDKHKVRVTNPGQSTEWLNTRVRNWNDPKSRLRDRYYCADHRQNLKCAAAMRYSHAARAFGGDTGHMAWAYQVPKVWFDFTSMTASGTIGPWRAGEKGLIHLDDDTWIATDFIFGTQEQNAASPLDAFSLLFDEYKLISAKDRDGNFEEAYLRALEVGEGPYLLIVHNCNQSVHYILHGFNADSLPDHYLPTESDYFHWITVPARRLPTLKDPRRDPSDDTPQDTPADVGAAFIAAAAAHRDNHAVAAAAARERRDDLVRRAGGTTGAPAFAAAPVAAPDRRPPLIDVVYRLKRVATLHLTPACPALGAASSEPEPVAVPPNDDLDAVAAELEAPVCGTCVGMIAAGSKVVRRFACSGGEVFVCRAHLSISTQSVECDIPYHRFDELTAMEERTPRVALSYAGLGDGRWVRRQLKLGFADVPTRNAFFETLDAAAVRELRTAD